MSPICLAEMLRVENEIQQYITSGAGSPSSPSFLFFFFPLPSPDHVFRSVDTVTSNWSFLRIVLVGRTLKRKKCEHQGCHTFCIPLSSPAL